MQEVYGKYDKLIPFLVLVSVLIVFLLIYHFCAKPLEVTSSDLGKNWATPGAVKAKGKPEPKRNLKDISNPEEDRELFKQRFRENTK